MHYRIATYISLFLIAIVGVIYIILTLDFSSANNQAVGPGFFPLIVCGFLIVMCVLSALNTLFSEKVKERTFEIPNSKLVLITGILLVIFVGLWTFYGFSYLASFIFLFILFYLYNDNINIKPKIIVATSISLFLTIFVYIIFENILGIVF